MKIRNLRCWILTGDLLWVLGALGLGIYLRYAGTKETTDFILHFQAYSLMILAAIVTWTLLYFEMSLDGFKGGWNFPDIVSKVIVGILLLMVVVLAFAFLAKQYYSRLVLLYFALFFGLGLLGVRCLIRF